MTLSREAILAAQDLKIEKVPVPEWGGDISIRVMTGAERDAYIAEVVARRNKDGTIRTEGLRELLVSLCACDADGKPLFTRDDTSKLAEKSAAVLDRLAKTITEHNAMDADATERAEKN